MINAIFACDEEWGIGKNGTLPWPHNPADLKWFKQQTNGKAVVMGKNTWDSLPIKPLPNRLNFVITSTNMENYNPRPHAYYSGKDIPKIIKDVIEARYGDIDDIWIIGGSQLFESCISIVDQLWISNITGTYACDVFLPKEKILENFYLDKTENASDLCISKWINKFR